MAAATETVRRRGRGAVLAGAAVGEAGRER